MKKAKLAMLMQASVALCLLFMGSVGISVVLAQSRAQSDAVSHAEHEQLRAELEVHNVTNVAKIEVLQQRLNDDEKLMTRASDIAEESAAAMNRIEGIGISFALALAVCQYILFRAHQKNTEKEPT